MRFIAYYTPGPYEDEARSLTASLDSWGLPHDIRRYDGRGSWLRNTSMKAEVVRDFLDAYPDEPLVYIDVDAAIERRPDLLLDGTLDGIDIAAAKFGGHELLSGTVWFGGGPVCRAVVERWIALCHQYPDRIPPGLMPEYPAGEIAWDQRLLNAAIQQTPGVKFHELPPAYTFIYDLSRDRYPGVEPIILHHAASRKYRDKVNA